MFVSTLSRPWEKLVTIDGHTVGVDNAEQEISDNEDDYAYYEVTTDKAQGNDRKIEKDMQYSMSNYDELMADKVRQYHSRSVETPNQSLKGIQTFMR
jgi:hypothetical protein